MLQHHIILLSIYNNNIASHVSLYRMVSEFRCGRMLQFVGNAGKGKRSSKCRGKMERRSGVAGWLLAMGWFRIYRKSSKVELKMGDYGRRRAGGVTKNIKEHILFCHIRVRENQVQLTFFVFLNWALDCKCLYLNIQHSNNDIIKWIHANEARRIKKTHTQTHSAGTPNSVSNSKTNHDAYNQIRIGFAFVDALYIM